MAIGGNVLFFHKAGGHPVVLFEMVFVEQAILTGAGLQCGQILGIKSAHIDCAACVHDRSISLHVVEVNVAVDVGQYRVVEASVAEERFVAQQYVDTVDMVEADIL